MADGEIYIDGASSWGCPRIRVNRRELAALSQVCRLCGGMCCKGFRLRVSLGEDGKPDFDAWLARCESKGKAPRPQREDRANVRFAKAHFAPRPGQEPGRDQTSFDCSAQLRGGLCGAYASRPPLCRGFVCASAWYRGMPPDMDYMKMESQAAGGAFEGLTGIQVTLVSWTDAILPRLTRERKENGGLAVGEPRRLRDCDPADIFRRAPAAERERPPWLVRRITEKGWETDIRRDWHDGMCWRENEEEEVEDGSAGNACDGDGAEVRVRELGGGESAAARG